MRCDDFELHALAVDVAFEVEQVRLDRDVPCVEGGPLADVRRPHERPLADVRARRVDAQRRQGAVGGDGDVRRREADRPPALEPVDDGPGKPVGRPRSAVTRSMSPSASALRTAVEL